MRWSRRSAGRSPGRDALRRREIPATGVDYDNAGEISSSVQKAARGTQQVDATTADVNKGASDTGNAATELLTAAQELTRQLSGLTSEVERFLAKVRMA